jgi:hypothetical protein
MTEFTRTIQRTPREQIRVQLSHWMGTDRLNIRIWTETESGYVATKAGFTLPLDNRALGFGDAVIEALQEAKRRGLFD